MADLFERGDEPEFIITDLAWSESTNGGTAVRLCFANQKHGRLITQYTVVMAIRDLARVLKDCSAVVSDTDPFAWGDEETSKAH